MCGIVGYITLTDKTRISSKDRFFKEGMYANALRGMDSTGIMTVRDEFLWSWQKQAVPAYDFINEKDFQERDMHTWAAVGHSRSATVGGISTDNAHPFRCGAIMLVHNGTLRSTFNLTYNPLEMQVDSEILCYNLSKVEPKDAHEVLGKVLGAYALVWFDTRDETINIARNSERPFHMGMNSKEDMLVFSSDGFLLNFITQRLSDVTARPSTIYSLGAGSLLKYKKGSLVPEVTKIVPFSRPIIVRPPAPHMGTSSTDLKYSFRDNRLGALLPRPGGKAAEMGKCRINGVYRRIPEAHSVMVRDWYGLDHDQDMFFEPHDFIQWGRTEPDGMTLGQLFHAEWDTWFDARVEDVTKHTAKIYDQAPWTVRVIGVDHTDIVEPRGGCTFICKPVYYRWEGDGKAQAHKDALLINKDTSHTEEDVLDPDDLPWMLPGPHGRWIEETAWNVLTKAGCVMCGDNLFTTDAEELEWVGEMANQPLCYACLEHSTDLVTA